MSRRCLKLDLIYLWESGHIAAANIHCRPECKSAQGMAGAGSENGADYDLRSSLLPLQTSKSFTTSLLVLEFLQKL